MKRERDIDHSMTMANCLMLLSRGGDGHEFEATYSSSFSNNNMRVFECKTCNRQFPSFQALGGHRASHKKPRLSNNNNMDHDNNNMGPQLLSPQKPKTHECSICGLEFAIGQALGGHMRRHRAANLHHNSNNNNNSTRTMSSNSSGSSSLDNSEGSNKKKRVLVLDLNLTPFENDLEFLKIGKATDLVDYLC